MKVGQKVLLEAEIIKIRDDNFVDLELKGGDPEFEKLMISIRAPRLERTIANFSWRVFMLELATVGGLICAGYFFFS